MKGMMKNITKDAVKVVMNGIKTEVMAAKMKSLMIDMIANMRTGKIKGK
jgi:hypothetical protein